MHLHEVDVHEERLGIFSVFLDVVDSVVGLPNVKVGQVIVGNVFASLRRLPRNPLPFVHVHDVKIRFRDFRIVRRKPRMEPLRGVGIGVDARIIRRERLHLIKTMLNWIGLGLVAERPRHIGQSRGLAAAEA